MKKVERYMCERCGRVYPAVEEAETCEQAHAADLNVVDMKFEPKAEYGYGFPDRIQVEIVGRSGCLAEYHLGGQGPVEGFDPYFPDEYYDD